MAPWRIHNSKKNKKKQGARIRESAKYNVVPVNVIYLFIYFIYIQYLYSALFTN